MFLLLRSGSRLRLELVVLGLASRSLRDHARETDQGLSSVNRTVRVPFKLPAFFVRLIGLSVLEYRAHDEHTLVNNLDVQRWRDEVSTDLGAEVQLRVVDPGALEHLVADFAQDIDDFVACSSPRRQHDL